MNTAINIQKPPLVSTLIINNPQNDNLGMGLFLNRGTGSADSLKGDVWVGKALKGEFLGQVIAMLGTGNLSVGKLLKLSKEESWNRECAN